METYRVRWTRPDGERRDSVVSYDRPSAEERVAQLAAQGITDAEAIPVQLGK